MTDASAALRAYVLEDDPDIAALEADLLREMGFGVVTCTRIVELGDLMEVALPHLLVVDVMLPDGDGGDITELLRTRGRESRDLRLGRQPRSACRARTHRSGGGEAVDLDAFRVAVNQALDGDRELRSAS